MKRLCTYALLFFWTTSLFGSEACYNYYSNPSGITSSFNYTYFEAKRSEYYLEIKSGKIESKFNTPEEKMAFLEALASYQLTEPRMGWSIPDNKKLQEKLIKYAQKLDVKRMTMYQVNKFISFSYKERLQLFYPVKRWGQKPLSEITDEQVVARVEEEIMNLGLIKALQNLGFIGDPVGHKRFMSFLNQNEEILQVAFSTAFNSILLSIQGMTWFTPLAVKLPPLNFFNVNKKFYLNSETTKTTLLSMFKEGNLKARDKKGKVQLPGSTYASHYYAMGMKVQLPLFFAALWSSIGINMYGNLGGPNNNGVQDVIVMEIVKTKDQAVTIFNTVSPIKIGDQNEKH